ncbi:uncharacterized protein [Ambystoma mexicanum]|uniref:uncharacterized protein n=1 Tax=Ambystoma mexicanum TaxID=8296 RepID=UPI0037E9B972
MDTNGDQKRLEDHPITRNWRQSQGSRLSKTTSSKRSEEQARSSESKQSKASQSAKTVSSSRWCRSPCVHVEHQSCCVGKEEPSEDPEQAKSRWCRGRCGQMEQQCPCPGREEPLEGPEHAKSCCRGLCVHVKVEYFPERKETAEESEQASKEETETRVLCRWRVDGFYYPGHVMKTAKSKHVLVCFDMGILQETEKHFLIPMVDSSSKRSKLNLKSLKYVLLKTEPMTGASIVRYVPGIATFTKPHKKPSNILQVVTYREKPLRVRANDIVMISEKQYYFILKHLARAQKEDHESTYGTEVITTAINLGKNLKKDNTKNENATESGVNHANGGYVESPKNDALPPHSDVNHANGGCVESPKNDALPPHSDVNHANGGYVELPKHDALPPHSDVNHANGGYVELPKHDALPPHSDVNHANGGYVELPKHDALPPHSDVNHVNGGYMESLKQGPPEQILVRNHVTGWYTTGRLMHDYSGEAFLVQTEDKTIKRFLPQDIIQDSHDQDRVIKVGEAVICPYPVIDVQYCPAVVLHDIPMMWLQVRYYDGTEGYVPREETYGIDDAKMRETVAQIQQYEEAVIGRTVVARNDKDGTYYLGTVGPRNWQGPRFLIEWTDESCSIQEAAHMFAILPEVHDLVTGSHVLGLASTQQDIFAYMPGIVMKTDNKEWNVQFINGQRAVLRHRNQMYWISETYYKLAEKFYEKKHSAC